MATRVWRNTVLGTYLRSHYSATCLMLIYSWWVSSQVSQLMRCPQRPPLPSSVRDSLQRSGLWPPKCVCLCLLLTVTCPWSPIRKALSPGTWSYWVLPLTWQIKQQEVERGMVLWISACSGTDTKPLLWLLGGAEANNRNDQRSEKKVEITPRVAVKQQHTILSERGIRVTCGPESWCTFPGHFLPDTKTSAETWRTCLHLISLV